MVYHHGDLRSALLAAGEALLSEDGLEAITLRGVASRVGVSHAAPYRHFADKQALLAGIAQEGFNALRNAVRIAAEDPDLSAFERLLAALNAYLTFGADRPQTVDLMFGLAPTERTAALERAARASFSDLVSLVALALQAADLGRAMEATRIAIALWSQVHGMVVLSRRVDFSSLAPQNGVQATITDVLEATVRALLGSS
jgi:AcrR family transcriptional regulator